MNVGTPRDGGGGESWAMVVPEELVGRWVMVWRARSTTRSIWKSCRSSSSRAMSPRKAAGVGGRKCEPLTSLARDLKPHQG